MTSTIDQKTILHMTGECGIDVAHSMEDHNPGSKWKTRYIEVTYDRPGVQTMFRAAVFEADSPASSFYLAKLDLLRAHPDATNVEEFMQRILTDEQAEKIRAQIQHGTWEGWDFSS